MNNRFFAICFYVVFLTFGLTFFAGCQESVKGPASGADLLTVDFAPGQTLKYSFVSNRTMSINLDPSGKHSKGKKSSEKKVIEKLELVMAYTPVEIDPYGYSVIQAKCESAKVTRRGGSRSDKDAVEFLAGKTFTLKITPAGEIADYTSLTEVVKALGDKAFSSSKRGRIKNPDMIMDFIATQWALWDSAASIKNPLKGIKKGQKWSSKLIAPMPFVKKVARNVDYKLADIASTDTARVAIIESTYSLADSPVDNVPLPYGGSFQMRGMFGFLRGYEIVSLAGAGTQEFDIERGLIISDTQSYQTKVKASIFGLGDGGVEPNIIVDQTIEMKLLE